ncbi:MAG: hypothetical protein FJZ66_10145, partial [Bacteroidetes bacterium]|nr:hypothetical protein [Bacteroidota bacterium]
MIISKKKDVHYQLELKDHKLNSLLEITNAINLNLATDKLLKIYAFILKEQLGFRKFVLLHANENWDCIVKVGFRGKLDFQLIQEHLSKIREVTLVESSNYSLLQEFQAVI